MNLKSLSPSGQWHRACRGMTLLELMITLGSGSVVMGSMMVTGGSVTNSIVAIANYNDLNRSSRNTLDTMTRDLRNTASVTFLSTNLITVSNTISGDITSYSWGNNETLTRIVNGSSTVMLKGCDQLFFAGYQRNPTNNLQFAQTTVTSKIKLISVSWHCSRKILGAKLNTESVQTAQICIRN